MRYAVLGDIHANLTALEAVLEELKPFEVDEILSVGDLVGYGPSPRETLERVREEGIVSVRGNHDEACSGRLEPLFFSDSARRVAEWTRGELTGEERRWLANLPLSLDLEGCSLAHATYDYPREFRRITTLRDARASLEQIPSQVCFVGHTHVPVAVLQREAGSRELTFSVSSDLDLSSTHRALINPGSVGQPRDEDPRAAFGIFDVETSRYQLHRVSYDIAQEAERVRRAGIPSFLAERLALGV